MTESSRYTKYVGLDVHKETIAVAIADAGGGAARRYGEIGATREAVAKLLEKLGGDGERLRFSYEAGPSGYELYRQLTAAGQACLVAAPALIPRRPGERVKTDRRDAASLARLDRAGELTAVWVPGPDQEAVRDLSRAREDAKSVERQLRQRLGAFLLRHGRIYPGRRPWTAAHWKWLDAQRFERPAQQLVLAEYEAAIRAAEKRSARLEQELQRAVEGWSLGPTAEALTALRGVSLTAAATLLAELDDVSRFDSAGRLMSFVGLVPSESSSGGRRRQGGLTKTGNAHARRMLIECAWSYRFPARLTPTIRRRAERAPEAVQAIAWQAQLRLCGKYRRLVAREMPTAKANAAVARELCGFVWAVARAVARPEEQVSAAA